MVINLARFTKEEEVVAPIVGGWGKYHGRRFEFPDQIDNWYKLKIGNEVEVVRPATPLEVVKTLKTCKHYLVFAYGEEGIPANFDSFKKMGFGETVKVQFFNVPLFTTGKVVLWEDGRFYFFEPEIRSFRSVLNALRGEKRVRDIKDLTPELAYYNLLINLTKQAFREVAELDKLVLSPEEKEKRVKQFENTLEGRLKKIIEDSGGRFIDYKQSRGKSLLVTWEVGGQQVKSQIKGETFQIVSAGYCLSGDDKRHTMNSIVRLAKVFQKDAPLYITRD